MAKNRRRGYVANQLTMHAETTIINTIDYHTEKLADRKIADRERQMNTNGQPKRRIVRRTLVCA